MCFKSRVPRSISAALPGSIAGGADLAGWLESASVGGTPFAPSELDSFQANCGLRGCKKIRFNLAGAVIFVRGASRLSTAAAVRGGSSSPLYWWGQEMPPRRCFPSPTRSAPACYADATATPRAERSLLQDG